MKESTVQTEQRKERTNAKESPLCAAVFNKTCNNGFSWKGLQRVQLLAVSTHRHYLIKSFLAKSAIICQTFTNLTVEQCHIIYLHYRYEVNQRDKEEFVFSSFKQRKPIIAVQYFCKLFSFSKENNQLLFIFVVS